MTAFPVTTPVAVKAYGFNELHVAAAAALKPGDLYVMADGTIGAFAGLEAAAIDDPVTFYRTGAYWVLCNATSDTYAAGAAVYFDPSSKKATTTIGGGNYLGTAVLAKVSGTTRVLVQINNQIPGTAIVATTISGTNGTLSGTLAVTGASTLTGLLTANGGLTMGGKLALTASNTPVAAAGSAYTDAAAVGAQDIITISSDSAGKGVKLLTGAAGQRKVLINTTATACKLYPATGGTLSGLSANVNVTIGASHVIVCVCVAADTWYVEDAGALLAA